MRNNAFWIIFLALMMINPSHTSAKPNDNQKINIGVMPESFIWDIDNMKPGDWAPRTIEVRNKEKQDFAYQISVQNNGDEKLFKKLLIEISNHHTEIFKGKLADINSLPLRELTSGSQEELHMTVRFPKHLKNDFQGLESHFSLIFTAEGKKKGNGIINIDTKDTNGSANNVQKGAMLPKTATSLFNLLLIGGILLVFGVLISIYAYGFSLTRKKP